MNPASNTPQTRQLLASAHVEPALTARGRQAAAAPRTPGRAEAPHIGVPTDGAPLPCVVTCAEAVQTKRPAMPPSVSNASLNLAWDGRRIGGAH